MDDDQKKIALGAVIAMFGLMILFYVFSGSTSKTNKIEKKVFHAKKHLKHINQKNEKKKNTTGYQVGGRGSSYERKSPFTKEEIELVNNEIETEYNELLKVQEKWALAKISDTSLTAKTREKYRFKMIKSYGKAIEAMKKKNYRLALKEFRKSLKDPMASPVTQYMAYMYMKSAAQKLGDLDLYLLIADAGAELIATEDLSAIGIEKTTKQRRWVSKFGKLMRAANDKGKYRLLVDERMSKYKASAEKRPIIEKTINRQINEYRKHFKEFFKYAN